MNKELDLWKEKTKGIFHITEYDRFWNYIMNLEQINKDHQELNGELREEIARLKEEYVLLQNASDAYEDKLQQEIEHLRRCKDIRVGYLQLIADICFDYDGFNTVESLKKLIDEVYNYALWGRDCYDQEPIYENEGKTYNILDEEIGEVNESK